MHYDVSIKKNEVLRCAEAVEFIETLKGLLENPDGLLDKD